MSTTNPEEETPNLQPPSQFIDHEPLEPVVDLSPGHVLRLTPDEIAKIDKALTLSEGDRAKAAKLLGVAYIQISFAITRHPVLRASWLQNDSGYVEPVSSDSPRLTHRHPPGEVSAQTPEEIRAQALTNVENKLVATGPDKSLSKSLGKLGFRVNEIEKLTSMEEFAGQHFTKTLSLMHGGIIRASMRLMMLMEKIEETYLTDDGLDEKERNWWWDVYFRSLDSLRMMTEQGNKAAITRALVSSKKSTPLGKPGFSPTTAIQINATGSVEVKNQDGQTK